MPRPNTPNTAAATAAAAAAKRAIKLATMGAELTDAGWVAWSPGRVINMLATEEIGGILGPFLWGYLGWPGNYRLPSECDLGEHDHAACLRTIMEGKAA